MATLLQSPPGNAPEFTVSELSGAVKRTMEDAFGRVRVRGELSGVKRPQSGHVYGCLKDEGGTLDLCIWKTALARLGLKPEDGLEVIATGKLSTNARASKYQLIVDRLEIAGVGALLAQLERRKALLAGEGLFADARKRPLPFLPGTIGVITSPTGAVIRDILHRLADRFPRRVLVWPVPVQGEACAPAVAAAIAGFNAAPAGLRPDLIIVARGGGSIEDLWGFNDEAVVRAAAASAIPLISAVGHETDTTLIDLAADRRAPTPSAAAEMAVPVRAELVAAVASLGARSARCGARYLAHARDRVAAARLPRPAGLTGAASARLGDLAARLPRALGNLARETALRLERTARALTPVVVTRRHRAGVGALAIAARGLAALTTARLDGALVAARHAAARLSPELVRRRHGAALSALSADHAALLAAARARVGGAAMRARGVDARLAPALIVRRHAAAATGLARPAHALAAAAGARLAAARRAGGRAADPLRPALVATRARTAAAALAAAARVLEGVSHRATLRRGYAIARDGAGSPLASAAAARAAAPARLEFHDGEVALRPGGRAPRAATRQPGLF